MKNLRSQLPVVGTWGRGTAGVGALLLGLSLARPCAAQGAAPFELDYQADAACPARDSFLQLVSSQLLEAREAPSEAHAHAHVTLSELDGKATGRLELERRDRNSYVRELSGDNCNETARGLAFILAYALGGSDQEPPLPAGAAPTPTSASAPLPAPAAVPVSAPAAAPPVVRVPWHVSALVLLGVRTGLGPIWTPVEGVAVTVERERRASWHPQFRAAFLRDEPVRRVDLVGSTEFSWLAGSVDACGFELPLLPSLGLAPCLGAHVGRLLAVGTPAGGVGVGRRSGRLWADAALTLRLSYQFWRLLGVELQGGAVVPLTPYSFGFDNPRADVYEVPNLAFSGHFGLGVHFP